MKKLEITILETQNEQHVLDLLEKLQSENKIRFREITHENESEPVTEDQALEMIDEAELSPYYSESEAKKILNI